MLSKWKEKSPAILFIFNVILAGTGWVMAVYAYPQLPGRIPLWFDIHGQACCIRDKSLLYFMIPLVQTAFFLGFSLVARAVSAKVKDHRIGQVYKESVYLSLIFFNLVFIHIQRGLVFMAHEIPGGINTFYFYALFVIILVLIPYHRLRLKQI